MHRKPSLVVHRAIDDVMYHEGKPLSREHPRSYPRYTSPVLSATPPVAFVTDATIAA